jgi:hypothetical protein
VSSRDFGFAKVLAIINEFARLLAHSIKTSPSRMMSVVGLGCGRCGKRVGLYVGKWRRPGCGVSTVEVAD